MERPNSSPPRRLLSTVAGLAILFVSAISALALVGWVFNIQQLKSVEPRWIEMRVITALCLMMCAGALALIRRSSPDHRRRIAAMVLGCTVGGVALLTLCIYIFGLGRGHEISLIDAPLLSLFLAPADRMAMWTAGILLVTGCALVLLATGRRPDAQVAHALALPAALGSYLVPLSYLLGVESIHLVLGATVAMNTGIAFCALSLAVFCLREDTWLMRVFMEGHAGGVMARRLLPGLLIIPVVIGWLRLYGERQAIFGSEVGVVLVAMAYTVCLISFLWWSARSVNRTDRQRLAGELALRGSESRLRSLYASMSEGLALHDVIYDRVGTATDYRILEVNPAFERITGLPRQQVVGCLASVVYGSDDPPYLDTYSAVVRTGQPATFETYFPPMEKHFRISAFSPGQGRFATVFEDITERKRTESALRESEQRFATTLASIGDAVIATDAESRITFMNRVAEALTGWTLPEAEGKPVGDVFRVRDAATRLPVESPAERALRLGVVVGLSNHSVLLRKDGTEVPIDDSGAPIRDRDDRITGVVVVFRDITARIEADKALRESEEHFRALTEALPQIVWRAGPEGGIEWLNQHWYAYTGQGPEVGKDWSWKAVVHPDDLQETLANWERARQARVVYENEYRLRRRDGEYRWFLARAWPLSDSEGEVVHWVGTTTDIQEMKQAVAVLHRSHAEMEALVQERTASLTDLNRDLTRTLAELRSSQAAVTAEQRRFQDVLEMLPVYVALLSPDYRMPFANRFFRERFGESRGRCCYEFLFSRSTPCEICESFEVLKTRAPHHWEWTGPDSRNYAIADFPFTNTDGSFLIMEVGIDVTEQRRVEAELRALNLKLEQRATQLRALTTELVQAEDRERRRLAQILHDHLQQLLVAARFSAESLQRKSSGAGLQESATQMLDLLDQSIAASRSLTMELSPPVLHEAGLAAGLTWLARWMESKHNFKVKVLADPLEGELTEELRLLLFQAVRELLFNAVKHSGVHEACVVLDAGVPGDIRVTVSDEGVGFDAAAHEVSGLPGTFGLFTIRERLAFFDGRLKIDSGPGRGTRAVLTLPVRRAAKLEPTPRPAPAAAPLAVAGIPGGTYGHIRILVVDDHAVVRQGLVEMLSREPGLQVVGEAVDGCDAVEKTRALHPEVVLIDLAMPRMSGPEATRHITAEMPDVRVIGLSMHLEEEAARAMLEAGAVRYLSKDTPIEEIAVAIREVCRRTGHGRGVEPTGPAP